VKNNRPKPTGLHRNGNRTKQKVKEDANEKAEDLITALSAREEVQAIFFSLYYLAKNWKASFPYIETLIS
jgi:transcription-repair coupling factor (superfamily II helicase)